ncbi:MAG: RNA polymerase sigma-70 factor (ECF subfamily) [Cyclobacteriaceae bacterium]
MSHHSIPIHRDLVQKAKLEDSSAQYELYKLYQGAMFNVAHRIMGDEMDAEDVLQDAFVSAFQNLEQYREDASFGAWLKRIVINKSLNAIKKRDRVPTDALEIDTVDFEYEWEDIPDRDLEVSQVMQAIERLPDGFRTVLSLYLFEGYDHKEIAEILEISVSTSKTQYNRAKKKIREMIYQEVKYG